MSKAPFILLINPWITDFTAFDYWSKPLGLLQLASLLREGGCGVAFLDCLDRHDPRTNQHPDVLPGEDAKYGTGRRPRMTIPKPEAYADIPRRYYRFGIHPDSLREQLRSLPEPDLVWVTSFMTYWYPGVGQTISVVREIFPEAPVWLGGIYARLCTEHAGRIGGVDEVVTLPQSALPDRIEAATGFRVKNQSQWSRFEDSPDPALDLIVHPDYAVVTAGRGCPFRCPYCASQILQPRWERRSAQAIHQEITGWHERLGVVDFAFYDDALLLQAETTLRPALERICAEGFQLRFHTPNAMHIRALTPEWCRLLYESGFTTLRLGLETTRPEKQREWGGKVETDSFLAAVERLRATGFSRYQIGVYLLCGLPGQKPEEVAEAVEVVRAAGARPFLTEYSPVPGTPMWADACSVSPFDLREPLYHNNSIFACRRPDFTYEDVLRLKELAGPHWARSPA